MIKINPENRDAIAALLLTVNGKAETHTYTHYHQVERIALEAEERLNVLGITKKERAGAVFVAQSGSELPSAYKYAAQTTRLTLTRRASGWYLSQAARADLYARTKPARNLVLTAAQDAAAVAAFRRAYSVAA